MMEEKQSTIGICTWTLGIKDLDTMMKKIADLGLGAVQYCEHYDDHRSEDVLKYAKKHSLDIVVYDPFECGPGKRNGVASKENAVHFYKSVIDFSAQLNVGATLQGLSAWTQNCTTRAEGWYQIVSCVKELSDYANTKGVKLFYEPVNLYEVAYIRTAKDYEKLIEESGCKDISILLDSFHMNIGEKAPLQTLENYAAKSSIFHLSDSNREGLGQGHIDFKTYYNILKNEGFKGTIIFEFVLETNAVNISPRNETEMQELTEQIQKSVSMWRALEDIEGV